MSKPIVSSGIAPISDERIAAHVAYLAERADPAECAEYTRASDISRCAKHSTLVQFLVALRLGVIDESGAIVSRVDENGALVIGEAIVISVDKNGALMLGGASS